ncbi:MAG: MotA/TolQ/ExbB proton channel family protein [Lentisphaeraceae bacterium]|nr:MotA/TolQ/ExbB proton channel family protein [Lentisphaeraceae bacterium]
MKKMMMALAVSALMFGAVFTAGSVCAQEADTGALVTQDGKAADTKAAPKGTSFFDVVMGGGIVGFILWMALFSSGGFAIYFIIDGYILVRPKKIMPEALIAQVKEAMDQGDVMKAIEICDGDPSSMAKILKAGFAHVEEGFDVIDEAISAAGDLEIEHMMQRLNWISICSSLAPMLGLLGTVQGMILTFASIALTGVEISSLSLTISQALYTTAGGLCIAIPSVTFFYALRNSANRLVLRMQVVTADLIKNLRNVEVVEG